MENGHLRAEIFGENRMKQKKIYLQTYFDLKTNIQVYLNINNVIIWIRIFIWHPKHMNIPIFELIPGTEITENILSQSCNEPNQIKSLQHILTCWVLVNRNMLISYLPTYSLLYNHDIEEQMYTSNTLCENLRLWINKSTLGNSPLC